MILDNRRKELIKNSIKHYDFIKRMITNEIAVWSDKITDKVKLLEYLEKFVEKFKGVVVTNFEYNAPTEDKDSQYGYLDFLYNDVSMSVMYNTGDENIHVSDTYEIYDKVSMGYIIEDWLTTDDYTKMIARSKEDILHDAIVDLKWYESNNYLDCYNQLRDEIVNFLKEEW